MESKKLGKISYELITDPTTALKKISITNNASNSTRKGTIFKADYDDYIRQSVFNDIENSNTLRILCYDENHGSFLAEDLTCTLEEWLEQKLIGNGHRSMRSQRIRDYCDITKKDMDWVKDIMNDFNNVLGSITDGLGAIHRAKAVHGNLLEGVAVKSTRSPLMVKSTLKGILFNMKGDPRKEVVPRGSLAPQQSDDIDNLKTLVRRVFFYPYEVSNPPIQRSFLRVYDKLCLKQLQSRLSTRTTEAGTIKGTWGLKLAIFWPQKEQIVFMSRVYRLIYHELPKHCGSNLFVVKYFRDWNWTTKVTTHEDKVLRDVFYFNHGKVGEEEEEEKEKKEPYNKVSRWHSMDKLRFWRNCIEHMDLDKSGNNRNHDKVLKVFPELLAEVVEAFQEILPRNDCRTCVVSVFKDMHWDNL